MQKVRVPINSFQFGEVSESMLMRTDSSVYAASAQRLENMLITAEGAVKKRPGLKHIYTYTGITYNSSYPEQSTLFKFTFSDDERYIISVEHQKVRIFYLATDGSVSLIQTLTQDTNSNALPFNRDYLLEYTHAQLGDVMFICHPLFMPRMLIRTGLSSFEITPFTFDDRRDNKVTYQPYTRFQANGVTLDPSAVSGSGVTFTTSAPHWTANHVGTIIRYGTSEVQITSYTSSTVVVGTVIDTLAIRLEVLNPLRTRDGSAVVEVTHLGHGFAGGETITISNAAATGGINTGNLNGTFTVGTIIDENTFTYTAGGAASSAEDGGGYVTLGSHAPTTNWDEQSFSAVRGYPQAVVFHENRLCFGGTIAEPDSIWMSKIGDYFNFDVGTGKDNDAISLVAAVGTVNEIRYLVSNRDLQVFCHTAELYVPTYQNQALTPTNAQVRVQTTYGAEYVQPHPFDGGTLFVQNDGAVVREYLYTDTEQAYTASPVSLIASHLIGLPSFMTVCNGAFDQSESYMVLVNGEKDLALFSSNRTEQRAGWSRATTNGNFSSVCTIFSRLFVNIWGTDNKLYLCEFTGNIGLDRYMYAAVSSGYVNVSAIYPVGTVVQVIGYDGTNLGYLGNFTTVNYGGHSHVDLRDYPDFTHAYIGLAFTAKIVTNPIDGNLSNGPTTGEPRGISKAIVDVRNAGSFKVNGSAAVIEISFSGKKEVRILGYSRDPQITIEQNEPLPLQVNGIIAEMIV
jgi:hypothetical protein